MDGKSETAMGPTAAGLAKRHPAPLLLLGLQREDHLMRFFSNEACG